MSVNDYEQDAEFARALRETADGFEPPALHTLHAGAVARGRQLRRNSMIGVGLSAVAVLGVAGAATSAVAGLGSGSSGASGASGTSAAAGAAGAAADAAPLSSPTHTAVTTAAPISDITALMNKDLHETFPAGPQITAVQATAQRHGAKVQWNWAEDPTGLGATVSVTHPSAPSTCGYFQDIAKEKNNPQPVCTVTSLPGGGSFLTLHEEGKTALPTSLYLSTYTYLRPDGRELSLSQMQYGTQTSRISEDQARTMLTSAVWDSAAAQAK